MNVHWQAKRDLSSAITSKRIDFLYQLGINAGAFGGKLMGAGGGGFLLFVCPGSKIDLRFLMAKQGLQELFFHFDMEGAKVVTNV